MYTTDTILQMLPDLLQYAPHTGILRWKISKFRTPQTNAQFGGKAAGTLDSIGHRQIKLFGKTYPATHIAWALKTGKWPTCEIDHKNRVYDDDKWQNLREATKSQNCQNRSTRSDNTSGFKGISYHSQTGKWRARIWSGGVGRSLGLFNSKAAAKKAWNSAAKQLHKEFART